jgi:hypothetical protein
LLFVVTSDGEVYKQNTGWFGAGSQEYYLEYDARTGRESGYNLTDVKGEAARRIEAKIIGSWPDYAQAKTNADRYIKNKDAAPAPADPTKPADPFAPPPPPAPAAPAAPAAAPAPVLPAVAARARGRGRGGQGGAGGIGVGEEGHPGCLQPGLHY